MNPKRTLFAPEHELYRDMVARFIAERITPHHEQWEHEGMVPRELWRQAGQAGLLLPSTPESYGGGGGDFLHTLAVVEEIARALATGVTGFTTHSDIVAPYLLNFGTEDQKLRHLPAMARGDTVASLAITEPGAGSDVKAIRSTAARVDGGYLLNGQKTFITNGFHADRVLVAAKTDPAAGARGISLFWVDAATPGFTRGRLLDKVGQRAQDTAELFFQDVLVPDADLLGEPGQGFGYMMKELARERLMIAARCAMALESALQWTVDYARQRQAFGKALLDNQYIRFKLADIKTLAAATRAFVDGCVRQYLDGELDAAGAAMAAVGGRGHPRHRRSAAVPRRLRLHARIPDRQGVHGRPAEPHLRGRLGDHARADRPDALSTTG